ncbi:YncE family protein [Maribacter polysiphoniae]|uniref:YVTN family beta-propeller protein n=1 Tax=Maribacter polysiphoniae TaxID=429344 RepID=A0A316E1R4_9FLAO|nr:Calx-beta domain-containing protein [Maribacter polysiphoniae]MBD1261160.1 YncE family protein [Maribacter polysiphoniae]PWK23598.1 YVTN family beta-propeller protein [Maribacter polysiphoniae]
MKFKHFFITAALASFVFVGCDNDDDDDQPVIGALEVSTATDTNEEGVGTVEINFSTAMAMDTDVTISYEVTGTATSGEDYEALPGSIVLPAGDLSIAQSLTLIDDEEIEPFETLVLTIKTITGGEDLVIGVKDAVTLTITDNDSYPYENGIIVTHEGNFFQGNASVSFVSNDYATVQNDVYATVNDVDSWADNIQSMAFNGEFGYIVVNNSQKVEVVNRYTFESVATIDKELLNPRYMAIANGKGYVTNWGDGSDTEDDYVAVIDLDENTVVSKIPVAEGPERLVVKENTIYVAMQGGYNQNNIVTVIDATTNTVTTTVTVGDRPNSIQLDAEGNLWVLSGGNPAWTGNETLAQLDKINTADNTVADTFDFAATEHPGALVVEGSSLYYYMSSSVYAMEASSAALPETGIITGLSFYDMAVNDGKLYGVDAKDYTSNGSLEIYDLSDYSLLASKEVSIIPGEIYFNGTAER